MSNNLKAPCFKVESFGAVDGPGIRLVIFLQGCCLRCLYCHNPESWALKSSDAQMISIDEILKLYEQNKTYYQNDNGGITISGGEPTLHLDFLVALAKECNKHKIHLTIDTSAFFFSSPKQNNIQKVNELVKYANLWLVDIKHMDKQKVKEITGSDAFDALELIKYLDKNNKKFWVRHVLVPGITDDKEHMIKMGEFIGTLKNMDKFEILPYHEMAIAKYETLKITYRLANKTRPADSDDVKKAIKYIKLGIDKVNA